MQAEGVQNLFCGGEKGAPLIGHTEAVVTGAVAGHNAVCFAEGRLQLVLPDTLAVGLIISHSHEQFIRQQQYGERYTFSGGSFFELMKGKDLYSTNIDVITQRVAKENLTGIFNSLK